MPEFRVIGDELVKRYNMATRLKGKQVRSRVEKLSSIVPRRSTRRILGEVDEETSVAKADTSQKMRLKDDLVFVEKSPNFCQRNPKLDTMGTSGRVCKTVTENGNNFLNTTEVVSDDLIDSCEYLCCGQGYFARKIETTEDCDCQFQWCCSVKCKKCMKKIIQYVCR